MSFYGLPSVSAESKMSLLKQNCVQKENTITHILSDNYNTRMNTTYTYL